MPRRIRPVPTLATRPGNRACRNMALFGNAYRNCSHMHTSRSIWPSIWPCGSSISWCEFHPPQRRHRGADHVAVHCPLATAIARSAVGCCGCAAVTAMTSLPRTRTSVGFELITAITAVRSTTRSSGVQFPNASRRAGTPTAARASEADEGLYPFEKCTGVLRKLAWAARGARIVSVTLGRYSRLKRYAHTAVADGCTERWVRCAHRPTIR
jgi:hypothetical protein